MNKKIVAALGIAALAVVFSATWITASEDGKAKEGQEKTEEDSWEGQEAPIEMDPSLTIEPGVRIAVVTKSTEGSYWKTLKKGMEDAVSYINEKYGLEKDNQLTMTFEGPDKETNITDQINMIDAVLAENPGALCISAADMESCQAQLESARENGIPVIMFDSYVESGLYTAYCGADNLEGAGLAAGKMAQAMDEQGEILIIAHHSKTQTSIQRVEGFCEKLKEYPEMSIAGILYEDEQESMSEAVVQFLSEHPQVKGVFCTNSVMANLFLEVQESLEEHELTFVGFDADQGQQKAVEEERELGFVAQQPYLIGFQTIYEAVKAMSMETVDVEASQVLLDTAWIDKNRLNNEDYAQYLQ